MNNYCMNVSTSKNKNTIIKYLFRKKLVIPAQCPFREIMFKYEHNMEIWILMEEYW